MIEIILSAILFGFVCGTLWNLKNDTRAIRDSLSRDTTRKHQEHFPE